jgi:hypothetical protein
VTARLRLSPSKQRWLCFARRCLCLFAIRFLTPGNTRYRCILCRACGPGIHAHCTNHHVLPSLAQSLVVPGHSCCIKHALHDAATTTTVSANMTRPPGDPTKGVRKMRPIGFPDALYQRACGMTSPAEFSGRQSLLESHVRSLTLRTLLEGHTVRAWCWA